MSLDSTPHETITLEEMMETRRAAAEKRDREEEEEKKNKQRIDVLMNRLKPTEASNDDAVAVTEFLAQMEGICDTYGVPCAKGNIQTANMQRMPRMNTDLLKTLRKLFDKITQRKGASGEDIERLKSRVNESTELAQVQEIVTTEIDGLVCQANVFKSAKESLSKEHESLKKKLTRANQNVLDLTKQLEAAEPTPMVEPSASSSLKRAADDATGSDPKRACAVAPEPELTENFNASMRHGHAVHKLKFRMEQLNELAAGLEANFREIFPSL